MANHDKRTLQLSKFAVSEADPLDWVSPNFRLSELVHSDIALRRGIQNWFRTDAQLQAAVNICRKVLQPVRDKFGSFAPSSVYRSQSLERVLKGKPQSWVSRSQHTKGEAADIEIPAITNLGLAEWIIDNVQFDQVILECYTPSLGPNSGWVHVSLQNGANRRQILSYILRDGKYTYVKGLVTG